MATKNLGCQSISSLKTNMSPEHVGWKMYSLLKCSLFRGHICFAGCMSMILVQKGCNLDFLLASWGIAFVCAAGGPWPVAGGRWPVAGGVGGSVVAGGPRPVAGGRWPVASAARWWPVVGGRWPAAGGRWPVVSAARWWLWRESCGQWPIKF